VIPLRDDNPSTIRPFVSWAVLGLCVLVFLWQLSLGQAVQEAVYSYGVIPSVLLGNGYLQEELAKIPAWTTVFTSMFLHGGIWHLAGNLLYLWIFADNVEDSMGHTRFVIFYLLCGVAAALAQALPDAHSQIPMIGASGAISGVLGAYLLLFPHARVLVLIPLGVWTQLVRMPAAGVLGIWFLIQLVSSAFSDGGAGVAFGAHVGGFVAGVALIPIFKSRDFRLLKGRVARKDPSRVDLEP
jgi:membrane associated rhomboid family serine protease